MSCVDKPYIPLIGLASYICYWPSLVARQFEGIHYMPGSWELAAYTGLFKEVDSLVELDTIRCD
jgi:hypothetical protein